MCQARSFDVKFFIVAKVTTVRTCCVICLLSHKSDGMTNWQTTVNDIGLEELVMEGSVLSQLHWGPGGSALRPWKWLSSPDRHGGGRWRDLHPCRSRAVKCRSGCSLSCSVGDSGPVGCVRFGPHVPEDRVSM